MNSNTTASNRHYLFPNIPTLQMAVDNSMRTYVRYNNTRTGHNHIFLHCRLSTMRNGS